MPPHRAWGMLPWIAAIVIGTVTDRTTGQPLEGVTVAAGAVHATTHADGSFRLTGVPAGRVTVQLSSDDVPPQRQTIAVGKTTTHVALRACSTTLDYNCGVPQ